MEASGLPEVVVDGKTGWVLPSENPQSLAEVLRRLIIEPGRQEQSGSAGRQHVIDNYDWNKNVSRMEEVYQHVLSQKQAHARNEPRRAARM